MKKTKIIQAFSSIAILIVAVFAEESSNIQKCPDGTINIGSGKIENEHSTLSCQIKNESGDYIFHGPYIEWYPNGNILIKGNYLNGKKDG